MAFVAVQLLVLAMTLEFCSSAEQNQCILIDRNLLSELSNVTSNLCPNNNSSSLLIPYASELRYEVLIQYFETVYNDSVLCDQVIGDFNSELVYIIKTIADRSRLNVTLIGNRLLFLSPVIRLGLPKVLDFDPLEHYIKAVTSFTHNMNWTRVGLVSDYSLYYQFSANLLQKVLFSEYEEFTIPFLIETGANNFALTFSKIIEYGTKIMMVSMERKSACSLLEEATKRNFTWPEFGWIVLDTATYFTESVYCGMEGILVIQRSSIQGRNFNPDNTCYKSRSRNTHYIIEKNNISGTLYDSLEILSLIHQGADAAAEGFRIGQSLNNITITQIKNGSKLQIARYDSEYKRLTFVSDLLRTGPTPRGSIPTFYNQSTMLHNVLIVAIVTFCVVFITTILILYIIFRKEKEIKATSVTVSIGMFISSYLLVLFVPLLLVKSYPQSKVAIPHAVTCNFLAWLGGTSIPFSLILATIFVKMLRIYAIFQDPFSIKKKLFSDHFLFLYICLIISPTIIILIFWSATDPLVNYDIVLERKDHITVLEYCLSINTLLWLVLLLVYISILMVAVVIIGVKTSKIRYKNFQDTKATNAFSFVTITALVFGSFYWYYYSIVLPPSAANYKSAEVAFNVGLLITANYSYSFLKFMLRLKEVSKHNR